VKSFLRLFCILAPLTIRASGQDDVLKTPAVQARMSKLYADALQSFVPTTNGLTRKTELSFTLSADRAPGRVGSSHDWARDFVLVRDGDIAIVHTHPFGVAPSPSDVDVAIAVKLAIPDYVLSRSALWVALPDGTSHKVADVQWKRGQIVLKQRALIPQRSGNKVPSPPPDGGGH